MKKLFLLFVMSSFATFAQGFQAEGNNLVWEKHFTANNADIVALLEQEPNLNVNSFMDNVYKGTGDEIRNTCQGGSGLMKNNCKFDFLIIVEPDGYIVKVKNIKILEKYGPMQARTRANPCEKYYMDGNTIREGERSTGDLGCLDSYLTSVFSISPTAGSALTLNK